MKWTQVYCPTLKEVPREAEVVSHQLMLRAGMIRKVASGIYSLLPLGLKVLRKFESIVREEMNAIGGQEVLMPMVVPSGLWQESGRWEKYGKELLRINDRHDASFCLGPTHEEVVTDLIRHEVNSYKQLPLMLYQIQTKFRDEVRPRFGLMRGREFGMKDAYSFHIDEGSLNDTYCAVERAYQRIFSRCGLSFKQVHADNGAMGGSDSSEFMVTAETGEDEILECACCQFAGNQEVVSSLECPECNAPLTRVRGIEVGHIFKLGDTYAKSLNATVLDNSGTNSVITMGCYGIGIGRTVAAAIEQHHDEQGIQWPVSLAPFEVDVIATNCKNEDIVLSATQFYQQLQKDGVDVVFDDRTVGIGSKFKDAELVGIPYQVIFGRTFTDQQQVEVVNRKTGDKQTMSCESAHILLKETLR